MTLIWWRGILSKRLATIRRMSVMKTCLLRRRRMTICFWPPLSLNFWTWLKLWCLVQVNGLQTGKFSVSIRVVGYLRKIKSCRSSQLWRLYSSIKSTITRDKYDQFLKLFKENDCTTMSDWLRVHNFKKGIKRIINSRLISSVLKSYLPSKVLFTSSNKTKDVIIMRMVKH